MRRLPLSVHPDSSAKGAIKRTPRRILERTPTFRYTVFDSRGSGPMRAAATTGPADIVEGGEAMAISVRCWERYLTPAGMKHPGVGGLLRSHDPVCVRIEPGSWSWTDQGDVFDGLLESPELVLPHSD